LKNLSIFMQKSRRKALLGRQNRKAEQGDGTGRRNWKTELEDGIGRRNWKTELEDGIGNMALF
jgi:hypothetical protein